ncbi:MAG TPA: IS91 family transposase, partial [Spirochaetia bacterium]|nr:IS91 family transposase [Spirochaetia bacterium]
CGNEYLLAFSCKSRICSSCLTKHMLEFQMFFSEHTALKVPHRHFVFTMPKILRRYFILLHLPVI